MANTPWAADRHPDFARTQELQARFRVLPLLRGRVELPRVVIDSPQVHLARAENDEVNWPEPEPEEARPGYRRSRTS